MKFIFMFIIRLYQVFIPKALRGKCLFNESCSNYVYRTTKEDGLKAGIDAFLFRFRNCRSGYYIIDKADKVLLITAKKSVVEESDIDKRIINEYQTHNSRAIN